MTSIILALAVSALQMCALTVALWALTKFTPFGKIRLSVRRIIIGILFGTAAAMSTHFGIHSEDMVLTVRNMAPLSAGLFFDPWSALIAGAIGAADRYISGTFYMIDAGTTLASSLATMLAGVIGFLYAKFIFEGRKPSPFYALTIGAITEVVHMFAIFLLYINQIKDSFGIIRSSSLPLILVNAFGMSFTALVLYLLSGEFRKHGLKKKASEVSVSKPFQFWLLVCITGAFLLTFAMTYQSQTAMAAASAQSVLKLNTNDIRNAIKENAKSLSAATEMLQTSGVDLAKSISNDVKAAGGTNQVSSDQITKLKEQYSVYEIDVINEKGIITASSVPEYVGFDMSSGEQSRAFLVLLDGKTTEFVQDYQPISYSSSREVMYVGAAMENGFIQVGYDESSIEGIRKIADIGEVAVARHIGESGAAFVLENDQIISSTSGANIGSTLSDLGVKNAENGTYFTASVSGTPGYCYAEQYNEYQIFVMMNQQEMYTGRDIITYGLALAEILLFAFIYILIYVLVRRIIVRNLNRINDSLAKITNGDLNEMVNVRSSAEFTSLSHDINSTVATLKRYIKEAENRISKELEFAREIQTSALPTEFPAFPDHPEFDLFASMGPAKEVGGDFYDFFMTDETHLVLVMADVSGKGIPASLFMMKSKTLIKSLAESGLPPAEVLKEANEELCEGNDAEMFVTVWIGILDLATGQMKTSNAAHEFPAVLHAGGDFEYFRDKHGFVLAGLPGSKYKEEGFSLNAGDCIFVYTDGVTEATRADGELFGMKRLKQSLDAHKELKPDELLPAVRKDIDAFVGDAPQFDDITMLAVRLNQPGKEKR